MEFTMILQFYAEHMIVPLAVLAQKLVSSTLTCIVKRSCICPATVQSAAALSTLFTSLTCLFTNTKYQTIPNGAYLHSTQNAELAF